jgi:low temperature requirement protein LtrA
MTGAENRVLRTQASTQRATFLELFFDLVFVFALTRVSQRLITDFTGGRHALLAEAGETLVLFLGLWLVWSLSWCSWAGRWSPGWRSGTGRAPSTPG